MVGRLPMPRGWLASVGLALLCALATLRPAGAEPPGVPLPAEGGSRWLVIAGYNTGTHFGDDPNALDLVRTDAPTAGSLVVSPLDGVLSYVSTDCLTMEAAQMALLICHIWPAAGLTRGLTVAQGQPLGVVAPDFYANNGGIAHIHFAVHASGGDGYLGLTVPFADAWALEGQDLPYDGTFNQYLGAEFVSSNYVGGSARDPDFLYAGWNLVGWTGATAIAEATAPIQEALEVALTYAAEGSAFLRYSPRTPGFTNDLQELHFGDALWLYVSQPGGVLWPRERAQQVRDVALDEGFNLVTWTASARPLSIALESLGDALLSLHVWDPAGQRYRLHRPSLPAWLSEVDALQPGQALWVQVARPVTWSQR